MASIGEHAFLGCSNLVLTFKGKTKNQVIQTFESTYPFGMSDESIHGDVPPTFTISEDGLLTSVETNGESIIDIPS